MLPASDFNRCLPAAGTIDDAFQLFGHFILDPGFAACRANERRNVPNDNDTKLQVYNKSRGSESLVASAERAPLNYVAQDFFLVFQSDSKCSRSGR